MSSTLQQTEYASTSRHSRHRPPYEHVPPLVTPQHHPRLCLRRRLSGHVREIPHGVTFFCVRCTHIALDSLARHSCQQLYRHTGRHRQRHPCDWTRLTRTRHGPRGETRARLLPHASMQQQVPRDTRRSRQQRVQRRVRRSTRVQSYTVRNHGIQPCGQVRVVRRGRDSRVRSLHHPHNSSSSRWCYCHYCRLYRHCFSRMRCTRLHRVGQELLPRREGEADDVTRLPRLQRCGRRRVTLTLRRERNVVLETVVADDVAPVTARVLNHVQVVVVCGWRLHGSTRRPQ